MRELRDLSGAARVRGPAAAQGRASAEVVVLPGLGFRSYLRPWLDLLAARGLVTLLDLPGWSFTQPRFCESDVAAVGAAAAEWLAREDKRGVVLVGHSTGAQAAAVATGLLTGSEVGRVAGLVLASPVFDAGNRTVRALAGRVRRTLPYESWGELPAVVPDFLASGVVPMWRLMRSGQARDLDRDLEGVEVPVGIMTGRNDSVSPPGWVEQLATVAGRAPVEIHAGGHNACFVHPTAVDAAFLALLASLRLAP